MSEVVKQNTAIQALNRIISICKAEYDALLLENDLFGGFAYIAGYNIELELTNEYEMEGDKHVWSADICINNKRGTEITKMVRDLDFDTLRNIYSSKQWLIDRILLRSARERKTIIGNNIIYHNFRLSLNSLDTEKRVVLRKAVHHRKFVGCYCEALMMHLVKIPEIEEWAQNDMIEEYHCV